jgi:FkbM family methyltransferase
MSNVKSILYTIFAPVLRRWLKGSMTGKRIKGSNMVLHYDRSQHLGFLFSKEIVYEPAFSKVLLDQIKTGDLVFEIGSNIGQYSLQISEKLGPAGKLICVEPDSDNFKCLSYNIKENKCENVILVNKAVSDKEGKMTMYKDTTTGGRMSSLFREYTGTQQHQTSEKVSVTTLRILMDTYGIPSFIKVDVEGAEHLVFSDPSTLHPKTTYLIEVRKETKAYIFNLFSNAGFSIYLLEQHQQEIHSIEDLPDFANLLIKSPGEPGE